MEWIVPLAIVAAAAWAVRWQFRDVESPSKPQLQVVAAERREITEERRRAA